MVVVVWVAVLVLVVRVIGVLVVVGGGWLIVRDYYV